MSGRIGAREKLNNSRRVEEEGHERIMRVEEETHENSRRVSEELN